MNIRDKKLKALWILKWQESTVEIKLIVILEKSNYLIPMLNKVFSRTYFIVLIYNCRTSKLDIFYEYRQQQPSVVLKIVGIYIKI